MIKTNKFLLYYKNSKLYLRGIFHGFIQYFFYILFNFYLNYWIFGNICTYFTYKSFKNLYKKELLIICIKRNYKSSFNYFKSTIKKELYDLN